MNYNSKNYSTAKQFMKRLQELPQIIETVEKMASLTGTTNAALDLREEYMNGLEIMKQLSGENAELLFAHYIERKTLAEIFATAYICDTAMYKRDYKALSQLEALLKGANWGQ